MPVLERISYPNIDLLTTPYRYYKVHGLPNNCLDMQARSSLSQKQVAILSPFGLDGRRI
jgi:hypothetical protein